jgi:hypothetical protein
MYDPDRSDHRLTDTNDITWNRQGPDRSHGASFTDAIQQCGTDNPSHRYDAVLEHVLNYRPIALDHVQMTPQAAADSLRLEYLLTL